MNIEKILQDRSGSVCELCGNDNALKVLEVPPVFKDADKCLLVCDACSEQVNHTKPMDSNHWRCLNTSRKLSLKNAPPQLVRLALAINHFKV